MTEQEEMNSVLDELSAGFLESALEKALADGWPEDLAEVLSINALDIFLQDVFDDVPADEAFDASMEQARFMLMEDAYVTALAEGESRRDAFMILLGLELRLAENRDEPEIRFPLEWIDAGAAAIEAAAEQNLSTTRQIIAGFEAFQAAADAAVAA